MSFLGKGKPSSGRARRISRPSRRRRSFEAWRRMAEPINEDKALQRKALLSKVTNPRAARNADDCAGKSAKKKSVERERKR